MNPTHCLKGFIEGLGLRVWLEEYREIFVLSDLWSQTLLTLPPDGSLCHARNPVEQLPVWRQKPCVRTLTSSCETLRHAARRHETCSRDGLSSCKQTRMIYKMTKRSPPKVFGHKLRCQPVNVWIWVTAGSARIINRIIRIMICFVLSGRRRPQIRPETHSLITG